MTVMDARNPSLGSSEPALPAHHARVAPPSTTARLFRAADPTLVAHEAAYGPVPWGGHPVALIDEVRTSGLDGRGGAGFPVWRKLAAVRQNTGSGRSKRPLVVANGSEGEPLSRKDATLLRRSPHLVIDGLLLCAHIVGASSADVTLYVAPESADSVSRALAERADAAQVQVVAAPEGFVVGEATAVASALENGVGVPRDHLVHLSQVGVKGRPTLVQNVETLAHIALIARFGAQWFRSIGTADEPGTRIVTVSGAVDVPQVIEVAGGTPVRSIVDACMSSRQGGEPGRAETSDRPVPDRPVPEQPVLVQPVLVRPTLERSVRAVLIGGYHGGWVGADALSVALSRSALQPFGAHPGAGVLFVLGAGECGLETSANIADYLASQSARQCGPCVNGLPAMAAVLRRLATQHPAGAHRDPRLPAEIARLADIVTGRGSCSHPDGTARFVLSSLTAFETDVQAHLDGRCEVHS